jgi:hypothetical protein
MRTWSILLLAGILAFATAEAIKTTQLDLKDSADFIKEVQGDNQNVYIIIFEQNDVDYLTDLKTALDGASTDEILKGYDLFQADFDDSFEIKIGALDARDESKFGDALKLIGADDPNFTMTFPLALLSKHGKGFLASFTQFTTEDKKLQQHVREKLIEASGAEQKKAAAGGDAAAADPAPARR